MFFVDRILAGRRSWPMRPPPAYICGIAYSRLCTRHSGGVMNERTERRRPQRRRCLATEMRISPFVFHRRRCPDSRERDWRASRDREFARERETARKTSRARARAADFLRLPRRCCTVELFLHARVCNYPRQSCASIVSSRAFSYSRYARHRGAVRFGLYTGIMLQHFSYASLAIVY